MNVTLLENQELVSLELDLELILWIEEDLVPHFDRANVRSDSHRLRPAETARDLRSGRDQDPCTRSSLAFLLVHVCQDAVKEHRYGLLVISGGDLSACHVRRQC